MVIIDDICITVGVINFVILYKGAFDSLHNSLLLNENCNSLYSIHAIDEFPQNVHMSDIQKALHRNQSETSGLAGNSEVKLSSKVMEKPTLILMIG